MEYETGIEADHSQDKLDVEYRQILRIIKPYIQTINNNSYLAQYRIWLEKLSDAKQEEKFVRNQYLMELARQIQCKHLATPFTLSPMKGPLPPLRTQWNHEEPLSIYEQPVETPEPYLNKHRMCQQWAEENECNLSTNRTQWPYHTSITKPRRPTTLTPSQEQQRLNEAQRAVKRSALSVKKFNLLKEIEEQSEKFLDPPSSIRSPKRSTRVPPTASPPPPPIPKEHKLEIEPKKRHQSFISQNPSLEVIHEDNTDLTEKDSWCDMSDESNVSLAVLGSGDTDNKEVKKDHRQGDHFEKKINTLMIEINGLKRKSERMNEKCEHTLRTVQEQVPENSSDNGEERKKNIEEKKIETGKDGSYMNTDWKKIVDSLQVRLSETQNQNRELNGVIGTLHKKLKEMDSSKEQARQDVRKQCLEQQKKEIDSLKASHAKDLQATETAHMNKIVEIERKFQQEKISIETKFEDKVKELENGFTNEIRDKDVEIGRLEIIIQKECLRLVNEITVLRRQIEEASYTNTSNDERILFLQKCITKMDRLFQKSEREYCKQIEKLKQELDNREKAIQIQLQTQKAEVVTRCSAEKQCELDNIVKNLESKYTHLLDVQQAQICRTKKEHEKTIDDLRCILDQHNIPY